MIQKSILVDLVKEVLAENPDLVKCSKQRASCGNAAQQSTATEYPIKKGYIKDNQENNSTTNGSFGAVMELVAVAERQGKQSVANYLSLAVEAEQIPKAVLERIELSAEPFKYTKQDYEKLISELETTWSAPAHAKKVKQTLQYFDSKHCLKRSFDY